MDTAIKLIDMFNLLAPGAAQLILMVAKKDGTVAIIPILDEANEKFAENIKQAQDWLAAHPKA